MPASVSRRRLFKNDILSARLSTSVDLTKGGTNLSWRLIMGIGYSVNHMAT